MDKKGTKIIEGELRGEFYEPRNYTPGNHVDEDAPQWVLDGHGLIQAFREKCILEGFRPLVILHSDHSKGHLRMGNASKKDLLCCIHQLIEDAVGLKLLNPELGAVVVMSLKAANDSPEANTE